MRKLNCPNIRFRTSWRACFVQINDIRIHACLATARVKTFTQSILYKARAKRRELYRFSPHSKVGDLAKTEHFYKMYDQLVKKKSPARGLYNQIKATADPLELCGYCRKGSVSSLDHYLPKSRYPVFAVTPANLVPCCRHCNTKKSTKIPKSSSKQFIHPYFDDFDAERWLFAQIIKKTPPSVFFEVTPPEEWESDIKSSLRHHFEKLELGAYFVGNACGALRELGHELEEFESAGVEAIQRHIFRRAKACEKSKRNSWQTALYYACADSDWYCSGGYHIPSPNAS